MNDFDFDPTEADLASVEDFDLDLTVEDEEEDFDTWEDDYSPRDDRYDGSGVPSWSAWA